jgi:hypothetical protein
LGLDERKDPGPDGILKLVSVFKVPLTLLFNLSLSTGIFPAVWKDSFVVPIFKSGEKRDISCYRGIPILSVIPKLFEKRIYDEITLIIRPQISVMQHGFMKERPCYQLIEFFNFVIDKTENGHQVDEVYTDFSNTFDRVNHGLLCFDLMRSFSEIMLA